MSNLRVISDNAIDRAVLTASLTSASFPATNMQSARKSDVWRATGTSSRIGATWTAPESIQAVVHPYCNLSPMATMRVRVTAELPATNVLTAPNDFTNAVWTKTSLTVTAGVAGPDGANSAYTLAATAASAELKQARTVTAGANVSSIFIRRRAGSGAVSIRNAANTAWSAIAGLTGSWMRIVNDGGVTGTSAQVDILLATSGDAVDVAFAQLESGSAATSYFPGTRPLGYIDGWQSYTYDSGAQLACPAPAQSVRGFSAVQAASAYAFGGGACARMWLPAAVQAYGLAIDLVDSANLQGYLESAMLVAGAYWEAATNADYGASAQLEDSTNNSRNDAGDLISDIGTISTRLNLTMSKLSPPDRATLWSILRAGGSRYPSFISMFPGHSDLAFERDHQVYGKLVQLPAMALPFFNVASATLEVTSV